jgi:hypothetical protein
MGERVRAFDRVSLSLTSWLPSEFRRPPYPGSDEVNPDRLCPPTTYEQS